MQKRGLSGIVSIVIVIALVMAAGILVWNFVDDSLSERMGSTESCYNARNKLELDNDYTCYNSTEEELRVSISVDDIELEGLLISVSSETGSDTYELSSEAEDLTNIKNYPSKKGTVMVPGKDSGRVYTIKGLDYVDRSSMSIEVSPIVDGNQCDPVDSIKNVYSCSDFS